MAEVVLVCEGTTDLPVLAGILTTVLGTEIQIRAAGGSGAIPFVADYVARQGVGTVACVVDRDYRRREVADATFTDGKRGFMWRRHAIESYLLEPAVIVEMFRRLKASVVNDPGGGPRWVHALPEDVTVVAEGLRTCARARAAQEAGRLALARLWEDLQETAGRVSIQRPRKLGDTTVTDVATCREAVIAEAARILEKASATVASPHLDPDSVGRRYDMELARMSAEDYLRDLRFLEEQNGRELMGAFLGWLQRQHKSRLSWERIEEELPKAAVAAYRANRRLYGTDDFRDLANGVLALAGLPTV